MTEEDWEEVSPGVWEYIFPDGTKGQITEIEFPSGRKEYKPVLYLTDGQIDRHPLSYRPKSFAMKVCQDMIDLFYSN